MVNSEATLTEINSFGCSNNRILLVLCIQTHIHSLTSVLQWHGIHLLPAALSPQSQLPFQERGCGQPSTTQQLEAARLWAGCLLFSVSVSLSVKGAINSNYLMELVVWKLELVVGIPSYLREVGIGSWNSQLPQGSWNSQLPQGIDVQIKYFVYVNYLKVFDPQ